MYLKMLTNLHLPSTTLPILFFVMHKWETSDVFVFAKLPVFSNGNIRWLPGSLTNDMATLLSQFWCRRSRLLLGRGLCLTPWDCMYMFYCFFEQVSVRSVYFTSGRCVCWYRNSEIVSNKEERRWQISGQPTSNYLGIYLLRTGMPVAVSVT